MRMVFVALGAVVVIEHTEGFEALARESLVVETGHNEAIGHGG